MFSMPRGLATKKDIATVVGSLDRPVNVVMGLEGVQLSLAELSAIGVRRISVGSALYRTALVPPCSTCCLLTTTRTIGVDLMCL